MLEPPHSTRQDGARKPTRRNGHASPGGYIDIQGFDISGAKIVTACIVRVIAAARAMGIVIIFFQNGWEPGVADDHSADAGLGIRDARVTFRWRFSAVADPVPALL